jgi:SWI/SNF-related matrix-associated actin-dependent regulator of chromatin subfamily B protein 1
VNCVNRTAIAHSIREQVQIHTKCLNLIGYSYDGGSVHDEDLRSSFLPKITTILREEEAVEQFTPILEKLTEPEIDKLERDRERDKRYFQTQGIMCVCVCGFGFCHIASLYC